MAEEIKQRVTLDADQALATFQRLTEVLGRLEQRMDASGRTAETSSGQTQKLEAETRQLAQATERAASEQKHLGDATEASSGRSGFFSGVLSTLRGQLLGLVTAVTGGFGVVRAYEAWIDRIRQANELLQENARLARESLDAQRDLNFLSRTFDPQLNAIAEEVAVVSGRDPNEVRRTLADIKSRRPDFTNDQLRALGLQVAESGLTTSAPLQSISNALLTIQTFQPDPQKAQNILRQAIIDAGVSDPARISPLFAQFLGIGTSVGNLSPGQSAGAVAGVTGLGLDPSAAVTGLKNLTLGLLGQGSPEGRKILKRLGLDRTDLTTALRGVSGALQSGTLSEADLERIVGREGLPVAAALADPGRLESFLGAIERSGAAETTAEDITGTDVRQQLGANEQEALNLRARRAAVQERLRREKDERAHRAAAARAIVERELHIAVEDGLIEPFQIQRGLAAFDEALGRGLSPEGAAISAQHHLRTFFQFRVPVRLGDTVRQELSAPAAPIIPEPPLPGGPGDDQLRGGPAPVIHIGQYYNMNADGTTRLTEDSGRRDLR